MQKPSTTNVSILEKVIIYAPRQEPHGMFLPQKQMKKFAPLPLKSPYSFV